ncbi:MAG: GNAT family N-acetyltransferase [Methylovulum sp.]|uniref:GNAT family N-acetyltransferase n=1 Tax=Methylovulum sp. TaxID=1916980 RepID=UPI00260381AB|nr:GNAT family N-acetyltransferase [Methylovulum sp.]MDD2724651.1 GNAT family N-acetyltransferase [Methylovulum sp.]MDD5123478.1 GNAT family N-acetyltransferase [Methylovulum sp.]
MTTIVLADLFLPAHADSIVSLLNEYAQDPMGGGAGLPAFVQANLIAELRKRQDAHVFIAMQDDVAVGMAICFEGFSTFACKPLLNVHDMIVSANYRGRGISRRLLAKAEETAINLGCCKLTLEVLEGNTVAQRVYRDCGFDAYELHPKMGKAMFWQKKLV